MFEARGPDSRHAHRAGLRLLSRIAWVRRWHIPLRRQQLGRKPPSYAWSVNTSRREYSVDCYENKSKVYQAYIWHVIQMNKAWIEHRCQALARSRQVVSSPGGTTLFQCTGYKHTSQNTVGIKKHDRAIN